MLFFHLFSTGSECREATHVVLKGQVCDELNKNPVQNYLLVLDVKQAVVWFTVDEMLSHHTPRFVLEIYFTFT